MARKSPYDSRSIWIRQKWLWVIVAVIILVFLSYAGNRYYKAEKYAHVSSLTEPNMPNLSVKAFATKAAHLLYSYNYQDYREQMQQASKYFTKGGWQAFQTALQQSKNLETVKQHKLSVTLTFPEPPKVLKQGFDESIGRYVWKLKVPATIEYSNEAKKQIKQAVDINIVIVRTKKNVGLHGVGISQFIVTPSPKQTGEKPQRNS